MYVFIVNPVSGNGRGRRVWSRVEGWLIQKQTPYEVYFTSAPSQATELVRSMIRRDIEAVVAVGGDGTVHEVGNALVDTGIPLGYIPAGSGNDFAQAQGIPLHPKQALYRVLRNKIQPMDTARIGTRSLIGFGGIGFDGQVAKAVNQSSISRRLGRFAYLLGFLQTLKQYRPAQVTLITDGIEQVFDRVWLVAICNQPNYGGGMQICPEARSDDGLLNLCCVHGLSRAGLIKLFPSVYKGRHTSHPSVLLLEGRRITLRSDPPLVIHSDGEIIGETPLSIEIRPRSLTVL
ncbi:YegS/Rv2252/BmrU family lipid kinase [Kroppenstedtia sanguinis]|uniref:Diacylglycerol/lipid kinase family protein n=1 Tax=Kroppenstedtia sanguinis TaxID=1380684 RepID=A0ABW4CD07_9BACL